jgi:ribosomal-protein-alanine N-acetyltransferase
VIASLVTLDRPALQAHLEEILSADADTPGEAWTEAHFCRDLPGKWEISRLAIAPEGGVAGFLVGSVRDGSVHVHRVVVTPRHRGEGLGTLLLSESGREARRRGLESVTLKVAPANTAALRLYSRLGFLREAGSDAQLFLRAPAERLARAGVGDRSDARPCC